MYANGHRAAAWVVILRRQVARPQVTLRDAQAHVVDIRRDSLGG
jgi:hypothetical protein